MPNVFFPIFVVFKDVFLVHQLYLLLCIHIWISKANFFQGTTLAVAGGGSASVMLWDTSTWQLIATLQIPRLEGSKPSDKSSSKKFVLSVAWSPDGKRLACGSMDGTISIFDVARAKFLHHLEGHLMPVRSLVYSPIEPRLLFSGSDDAHIHMYDSEGKTLAGAMSGHASWVLSVDVAPDGAAIATGSSDQTVRLWDLSMRAAVQTMRSHNDQVWAVAFRSSGSSSRGDRLASVSDDKSISLYDYSWCENLNPAEWTWLGLTSDLWCCLLCDLPLF